MTMLPALLVAIPIGAAGLLWLARGRHPRVHWAGSAGAASFLVALVAAAGWIALPSQFALSSWQPSALFQSTIALVLDPTSWILALGSSALLVSVLLTSSARPQSSNATTRVLSVLYTGLTIGAVQASNLLTVILFWALADSLAFLVLLGEAEDVATVRGLVRRFGAQALSILFVMAATVPVGGIESYSTSSAAPAWIGLAVLFRVGLWPLHVGLPQLPGVRRGMGALVRLFPPVMALAVLGRFLTSATPMGIRLALLALGIMSILIGGLRWASASDVVEARPYLVLCFTGLAVAAASSSRPGAGSAAVGAAFGLLIIGGAVSQVVLHERWHRWLLIGVGVLSAGLPLTPMHSSLLIDWRSGSVGPVSAFVVGMTWLGLILVAAGALRASQQPLTAWESGEGFVRGAYGFGLFVLFASVLPPAIRLGGYTPTLPSSIAFIVIVAVSALIAVRPPLQVEASLQGGAQIAGRLARNVDLAAEDTFGGLLNTVARATRTLGAVFEGKGALLWVYVLLVVAALLVSGGGS